MRNILKIVGIISALVISVLGLSACSKNDGTTNVALYGVPYFER